MVQVRKGKWGNFSSLPGLTMVSQNTQHHSWLSCDESRPATPLMLDLWLYTAGKPRISLKASCFKITAFCFIAGGNIIFFQRDFWVCQRKRWLHCRLGTSVWHCQLGLAELFSLVCVRGINFRVSKGLQGECLQGEYKYIYGMKKRIVLI